MHNYVEIGRGRSARRVYGLNQITIVPSRRTRSSHDVDTSWKIDAYHFDIPVMSHPTDAVVSPEFAIAFGELGGLPVINAEGLWGRVRDLDAVLKEIAECAHVHDESVVADPALANYSSSDHATSDHAPSDSTTSDHTPSDADFDFFKGNRVLQSYHRKPIDLGLLKERLQVVRESGVRFAVRVSPQNARELAPAILDSGLDLLVIQGTLISAEHVNRDGEPLNLKEFIGSLDVPVIAGGVVDYTTALHLMRTGAAGVIVGAGASTNSQVLGIDIPLATAIADAAAARRDYLDETGGRYVHVIADSSLRTSGDIAKALACGADAVCLGQALSAAECAGTPTVYWPSTAAHPHAPRGYVDVAVFDEPAPLERVLFGPTPDPFGTENLVGGLRRTMAKCGYTDIKSFQKVDLAVEE